MPTIFTHGFSGLAAGKLLYGRYSAARFWALSVLLPMLPDADVIAFRLGIPYSHMLGHRGLSHSLLFAVIAGILTVTLAFGKLPWLSLRRWLLSAYFSLIIASHGVFDALTTGGLGVAFFAPFDNSRYFLPWRVVRVSPISPGAFFSGRGIEVMLSEMLWIWLPLVILLAVAWVVRRSAKMTRS